MYRLQACAAHCSDYFFFGVQYGEEVSTRTTTRFRPLSHFGYPTLMSVAGRILGRRFKVDVKRSQSNDSTHDVRDTIDMFACMPGTTVSSVRWHGRLISFAHHVDLIRTPLNTPCIMQCWCGAEGIDYNRHGKSTCDYTCSGEPSATCGGYLAFDLFGVPQPAPTPAPTPGPTRYQAALGCYKDVRTSRVFTNMISSEEMTPLVRVEYRRRDYCTPLVLRLNAIHG